MTVDIEQLHALARAVYCGQRGRISAREVYDQVNACSCLTLILACIVYWQAREIQISRMAAAPDFPFDPDLKRRPQGGSLEAATVTWPGWPRAGSCELLISAGWSGRFSVAILSHLTYAKR